MATGQVNLFATGPHRGQAKEGFGKRSGGLHGSAFRDRTCSVRMPDLGTFACCDNTITSSHAPGVEVSQRREALARLSQNNITVLHEKYIT
jgi:hypothetical protein